MSNLRTFVDRTLHRYVTLKRRVSHGSHFLRWLFLANVKSFALKMQFRSRRGEFNCCRWRIVFGQENSGEIQRIQVSELQARVP